jgi:hypothetical protein
MSEFKFACPVCGQHITADSSTGGGQIACPTCFQKIVVPQAPASAETKFILSAAQVGKPRPLPGETALQAGPLAPARARSSVWGLVALLLLVCAAGAAVFFFRDRIFKGSRPKPSTVVKLPPNLVWSLDLKSAAFPEANAAGRVHGRPFTPEHASLEGGIFSLRQGKTWPPELGITIMLPAQPGEELSGKTFEIAPGQPQPAPRLVARWKDDQQQPGKQEFARGYALKLVFEQPAHGHLPGKIYLCLPDEDQSVVAGTFEAALRKPKPTQPKGPKPKH